MGESNIALNARLGDRGANVPPAHVLDVIAERKITGGYRIGRANRCTIHNVARSVNGTCMLCE